MTDDDHITEIDQVYDEFWKDLVETDGQLDPAKVKAELHDYQIMLTEVPKVYVHITGGKLSKPFYSAETIIMNADEHYAAIYECERSHDD